MIEAKAAEELLVLRQRIEELELARYIWVIVKLSMHLSFVNFSY